VEGLDLLHRNPVNSALPETTWSVRGLPGEHTKILLPTWAAVFIDSTFSHTEYSSKS